MRAPWPGECRRTTRQPQSLQAADWRWSHHLAAWHLPGSRHQAVSILHVDEAAAALQAAGFEVSLRIDDERTQRRYSLKLVGDQILHLEGKLSKVDRLLDEHFRTSPCRGHNLSWQRTCGRFGCSSGGSTSRSELRHWRELGDRLTEGTPAHSAGLIDQAPYHDTTGHRHADDLDGPLP